MPNFFKKLITVDTKESSKSFALVVSSLVSALVGICVCFVLCWDVVHNGYVKTDMESMGIFMLCMGGYLAGGGASKILSDRFVQSGRKISPYIEKEDVNGEEIEYVNDDEMKKEEA